MKLELEKQEATLISEILQHRLDELRIEVRHNRDSEAREYLKQRESMLKHVLVKFQVSDERGYPAGNVEAA